jgi:NAD(P)H-quinone oxidoreductase subunit 4
MIAHGLISALLFVLVGKVYNRTGTRDVNLLRGLLNPERGLPITGSLMILGVMASAGIPGMVGFVSEFVVFRSAFPIFPVQTIFCLVGTGLTAVYFLLMINKVFFGRLSQQFATMRAVTLKEHIPAFILTILILLLGIKPNLMTYFSEPQAGELLGVMNGAQVVATNPGMLTPVNEVRLK